MRPFNPVVRLLWRPATLLLLTFPLLMALTIPLLSLGEGAMPTLENGVLRVGVPLALQLGVTLPLLAGLLGATASLELQSRRMAWTLPRLRRGVATGVGLLALLAALAAAALVSSAGAPSLALGAAGLALFWTLAVPVALDPVMPRGVRLLLLAGAAAAIALPARYTAVVTAQPVPIGLAGAIAAAALLHAHVSRDRARRRLLTPSVFASDPGLLRAAVAGPGLETARWDQPLHGMRAAGWVRAAAYETSGTVRGGLAGPLAGDVFMTAAAYLTSFGVIVALLGMRLAWAGVQLRAGVLYPLSRRERAAVQYRSNLLDVALLAGANGGILLVFDVLGVPQLSLGQGTHHWPVFLGLATALAPIAQWARVQQPLDPGDARGVGRHFRFIAAHTVAVLAGIALLIGPWARLTAGHRAAVVVILFLLVQVLHYVALRRYFARADLQPSR